MTYTSQEIGGGSSDVRPDDAKTFNAEAFARALQKAIHAHKPSPRLAEIRRQQRCTSDVRSLIF